MNKNSTMLARAADLKREGKPINKKLFHKSETAKLDGIPSWSTQAWVSCPGKTNSPVCDVCYAMEGRYVFGKTIKPRVDNMDSLFHPDFVREAVKPSGYTHSSGYSTPEISRVRKRSAYGCPYASCVQTQDSGYPPEPTSSPSGRRSYKNSKPYPTWW